eukprot:4851127-Prymnesium_polylepis.1
MLSASASFLIRTLVFGQSLTAAQGFTALALFGLLSNVLGFLPMVVNRCVQASVAVRRIASFLELPDVDGRAAAEHLARGEVQIDAGSFGWSPPVAPAAAGDEAPSPLRAGRSKRLIGVRPKISPLLEAQPTVEAEPTVEPTVSTEAMQASGWPEPTLSPLLAPTLAAVSLAAKPGELVCIYGACGGGKSSLLAALCGEVRHLGGGRGVAHGGLAYSPQRAWVSNATVRENILFGLPMARGCYDAVLHACALHADLEQFPAADLTELGERGINLSGGQQQRVSLARAVYAAAVGVADVVLLDDPLSALDAHVGAHVFHHAVLGLLK